MYNDPTWEKYQVYKSFKKAYSREVASKFESVAWQFLDDCLETFEHDVRVNAENKMIAAFEGAWRTIYQHVDRKSCPCTHCQDAKFMVKSILSGMRSNG